MISDKISRKGLVIEDDVFATQNVVKTEYVFPFSVDPVLYDPVHLEWNYAIGYPMAWDGFSPILGDEFTHSFYMKKGLNKFITATGYTQLNASHALVGHEVYVSSPFGPVFFNNALKKTKSVSKLGGYSKASFMTYPIYSNPEQWFKLMNFGISGSVRTPRFLPFGSTRTDLHENLLFQYAGSLSYQLMHFFSGTFQYSETKALMGVNDVDVRQLSAVIQRKLLFGFGLSLSLQRSVGVDVVEPFLGTFKVSWSGVDGLGVSLMQKQTVGTSDAQVDVSLQHDFFDGGLGTATTMHHSLEKKSVGTSLRYGRHSGNISYTDSAVQTDQQMGYVFGNQRFNSSVSYLSRQISGVPMNMLSINAESAIVYADHHVAVSTPVQDSFALFSADDSLKGDIVYVGDEGRKIDWLGPTVIPSLRDRVITDVLIDVPSLSVGSELDRLHSFSPVNFNAYAIELHVTPSVMLMGKLLKPNKKSARYLRGYVTSTEDPSIKEKLITSRSGIFQVSNLKPGSYMITFGKKPYHDVPIDIPSDAEGLYRISPIKLTAKQGGRKKRGREKSALEEQIEAQKKAKKQQEMIENKVSKIDLLQALINDILSEKLDEEVVLAVDVDDDDDDLNASGEHDSHEMVYSMALNDMATREKAELLHQLRQDVNTYLDQQRDSRVSVKDSIEIIKKINAFYLRVYDVKRAKNRLFNQQLRSTAEEAVLLHRQRQRDARRSVSQLPVGHVTSNALERSKGIHRQRQMKEQSRGTNSEYEFRP